MTSVLLIEDDHRLAQMIVLSFKYSPAALMYGTQHKI